MSQKYLLVYDEALLSTDAPAMATCGRAGSENNPHRHFAVFQFKIGDSGELLEHGVTHSMHQKEATTIITEAAKEGIITHAPADIESRLTNTAKETKITLAREREQSGCHYYVDLRNNAGTPLKLVAKFPDTVEGYKNAHDKMLQAASEFNLPYEDMVLDTLTGKK